MVYLIFQQIYNDPGLGMKITSDFLVNTSNEGHVDYMFDPSVDAFTPRQVIKACFLG